MLSKQKKLTIAIPTYNRANYLEILLNSILIQYKEVKEFLELIISDNASTDNTREVVDKYLLLGLEIQYFCQTENLGPDRNIANCFIKARGEYVWIVGDDDQLLPSSLNKIFNILKLEAPDLVYAPYIMEDCSRTFPKQHSSINFKVFHSNASFIKKVHHKITFISSNIINKSLIESQIDINKLKIFYGSHLVQLVWMLSIVEAGTKFIICDEPHILVPKNNSGGYKIFDVFAKNISEILSNRFGENHLFKEIIIKELIKGPCIYWVYDVRVNNNRDFINEEDVAEKLNRYYSRYLVYWIYLYPILKFPKSILKIFLFMDRVLNKLSKFIVLCNEYSSLAFCNKLQKKKL